MKRYPPLTKGEVLTALYVNLASGRCHWKVPNKYHCGLVGKEAGGIRAGHPSYWVISLMGRSYKRSYIVFVVAKGYWPKMIDHINGNSLDDRPSNLREATIEQNNWNHRRRKKAANLPMGVRFMGCKFQSRISYKKQTIHLGVFATVDLAQQAYQAKRKELYGVYSGL